MMERFVTRMGDGALLCDLVDAYTVGLENALRVMKNHPDNDRVGIRVDSGDIAAQCGLYFRRMQEEGLTPRRIVFEDEVTPETVRTRTRAPTASRFERTPTSFSSSQWPDPP